MIGRNVLSEAAIGSTAAAIDGMAGACPARAITTPAILLAHISMSYPNGTRALDDISLTVPQGQIFGLLGPNGAGKSTLIRILCGVLTPDSGSALVCGVDPSSSPREVKEQLCGLFQAAPMESNMRVREVLTLFSKFYRRPLDPDELLAQMGLSELRKNLCKTLSGGQRQRLAIARSLIGNPKVLILDEPTTGLDVAARHELMDIISKLRAEGRTIVISTHNIEEAEAVCDQVAVISRGKLFAVDTPQAIIQQYGSSAKVEVHLSRPVPTERLSALTAVTGVKELHSPNGSAGCGFLLEGMNTESMLLQLIGVLVDEGIVLESARFIRSGLEGAYLKLTGERIS